MKIKVEGCIGCGACLGVAPEVFVMNDDGMSTPKAEKVSAEHEESAREAMEVCPVGAISEVEE
ncbi:MAG: ferredoxin [Bacilli bacterium]|nr:ferredoxin [Bacilli bacterium]